jgi:murein L,D-transpeptidase YcbB/YkuD
VIEEATMSVFRTLSAVGAVLAGTVSASDTAAPPADPRAVRALLAEVGMVHRAASPAQVTWALRRFQAHAGLAVDGVAGPRTVQSLVRYAREARHVRELQAAA